MKLLKALICLAFFVLLVYSGLELGKPYYRYYSFKAKIEDIARFEDRQEKIIQAVMEHAQEMSIPVSEPDILISGSMGRYIIETAWTERVNLFDLYEQTYEFHIKVGE